MKDWTIFKGVSECGGCRLSEGELEVYESSGVVLPR